MQTLKVQMESVRQEHGIPALGAAILTSEQISQIAVVGRRRADRDTPATVGDRFHIGSCTKAMTATLIARLVDAGKLRWNQTIGDTFPTLRTTIHEAYHPVTLEQLLYHRGGLPEDRTPDLALMTQLMALKGELHEVRRQATALVLKRPSAAPPGAQMLYSNFGYMIAGAMAEQAACERWETLMTRWLFEPLGMRRVGFGAPGKAVDPPDQPRGHRDASCRPVEPGPFADNLPLLGPAGRVNCALRDWARFVQLHLQIAQGKKVPLLKPETAAKLHADPYQQGYAMGWGIAKPDWAKGIALLHAGSNTMWFAMALIAPALDRAWLVATNCASDSAQAACQQLLQRLRE